MWIEYNRGKYPRARYIINRFILPFHTKNIAPFRVLVNILYHNYYIYFNAYFNKHLTERIILSIDFLPIYQKHVILSIQ